MSNIERGYILIDINSEFPFESPSGDRCKIKRTEECYIETYQSGVIFCFKKGTKIFHNPDGPAIEKPEHKIWVLNGKFHRLDGPAFESTNGDKSYWVNDIPHRLDGPAIIRQNGSKEWWINGEQLSSAKEKLLNIWYENKSINSH